MALKLNSPLFVNVHDVVLRTMPIDKISKNAQNHLIMGDYARYLGEKDGDYIKVRSRNSNGWLRPDVLTNDRMLEVNFVDIGQGDGCHIVTPGDKIMIIDAGEGLGLHNDGGDNMSRFISWRYNLRSRDDSEPRIDIDYAIISHPDLDHYYGFHSLFENKKLKFRRVYHNGLLERPLDGSDQKDWFYDLGRKEPPKARQSLYHLVDTVLTNKEMHDLLKKHESSRKKLLTTLNSARSNNGHVRFEFVRKPNNEEVYLEDFEKNKKLSIEVLSPISETITYNGESKECLISLGNEGVTKNGHSISLKFRLGKVTMLLGGDLNADAQDYLGQKYTGIDTTMSSLERDIKKINEKLASDDSLSLAEKQNLEQERSEKQQLLELIITRLRRSFGCDVAKACHHGSSHVLDSFLAAIHPIATVISSGDQESHSHPRPDALGAFGKNSRGARPLIFSSELARSSYEFSYPYKFYEVMKKIEQRIEEVDTKKEKDILRNRMEKLRDSNVAKYGMITVRTDGERVIIAQKLERARDNSQQWDIYDLVWNNKLEQYEYLPH